MKSYYSIIIFTLQCERVRNLVSHIRDYLSDALYRRWLITYVFKMTTTAYIVNGKGWAQYRKPRHIDFKIQITEATRRIWRHKPYHTLLKVSAGWWTGPRHYGYQCSLSFMEYSRTILHITAFSAVTLLLLIQKRLKITTLEPVK